MAGTNGILDSNPGECFLISAIAPSPLTCYTIVRFYMGFRAPFLL